MGDDHPRVDLRARIQLVRRGAMGLRWPTLHHAPTRVGRAPLRAALCPLIGIQVARPCLRVVCGRERPVRLCPTDRITDRITTDRRAATRRWRPVLCLGRRLRELERGGPCGRCRQPHPAHPPESRMFECPHSTALLPFFLYRSALVHSTDLIVNTDCKTTSVPFFIPRANTVIR